MTSPSTDATSRRTPDAAGPGAPRRAWEHRELAVVSARPPLADYLQQLWDRRHFIKMHAWAQALGQHQGTMAGNAWLVLVPLLDGFVYWVIFGVVFKASAGLPDFIARLVVGILLFSWVNRSVTSAASSITGGKGLMRAFAFPRAALPVAAIAKETFTLLPTLATMLVLVMALPPHAWPRWTWLLLPLPLLLMTAFNAGLGLVLARMANALPDITKVLSYLMRFWLYLSGIVFGIERFGHHPAVTFLARHNPLFLVVDICRNLVLYGRVAAAGEWLVLAEWGAGMLSAGLVFFWWAEATYGRQRVA